eukprot:60544-Prymnesium_polylepis.1
MYGIIKAVHNTAERSTFSDGISIRPTAREQHRATVPMCTDYATSTEVPLSRYYLLETVPYRGEPVV